jgi:hypothetical protein
VYGPSVAGGGPVPGEPSKTMGGAVEQLVPVQVMLVSTVCPVWVFVVVWPSTVVVCVTVHDPDVLQSAPTSFVWP